MRAARIAGPGQPFTLDELPIPEPAPDEVLVRVAACGICASDVHIVDGMELPPGVGFPIIPGHEVAGTVVAVGSAVQNVSPGARVAAHPNLPCGRCTACRRGAPNLCAQPQVMGFHRAGGYCEYTTVPASGLLRVPDGLAWEQAAIVPDAVATPWHALTARANVQAGESVAVFGLGGLGAQALMLARHLGAGRVISVLRRDSAAELAQSFGATNVVIAPPDNPVRAIRNLTGGGADAAVDFTGAPASVAAATACLRPGGRAVVVGMDEARLDLMSSVRFARLEITLMGSYTSTLDEAQQVMDLAGAGALDLSRSVTHRFALDEVNAAYAAVRNRQAPPVRAVLMP